MKFQQPPPEDFRRFVDEIAQSGFRNLEDNINFHCSALEIYQNCVSSGSYWWLDPHKVMKETGSYWKKIYKSDPGAANKYFRVVPATMKAMRERNASDEDVYAALNKLGEYTLVLGRKFLDISVESRFCSYKVPSPPEMLEYRAEVFQMPKTHSWAST